MKNILFLLLILSLSQYCFSQEDRIMPSNLRYSIKGTAIDTAEKLKLSDVSIVVIGAKDSILQAFTRTNSSGDFELTLPRGGALTLIVHCGSYADYTENFSLDTNHRDISFGAIQMMLKKNLLQEVVIKGNVSAIKIKGDTTQYDASAFKVQANANVEDLLKQLPGIQIDKDGKITAQGVKIRRVMVDGEEFFGDDPTLVTRNLRADMVDKVQVYDKKSEQAAFTGVDDGNREKVVNVKLKSDKKNGYFGKLEAGVATDKYFQAKALFNRFTDKQKFSFYAIWGNDGLTGLGWQDNGKYASSTVDLSDPGIVIHLDNGDEFDNSNGTYNGKGKPLAKTEGVHYDNKWDNNKQALNLDYKIGSLVIDGTNSQFSNNSLPSGVQKSLSDQSFHHDLFRHKLSGKYSIAIDSSSMLKIGIEGFLKQVKTGDNFTSSTYDEKGLLLNDLSRSLINDGTQKNLISNILYTKKLKKIGRTYSIYVGETITNNNSSGLLISPINFYDDQGDVDSSQNIDQQNRYKLQSSTTSSNITYTEPLGKMISMSLNYAFVYSNNISDREVRKSSIDGVYDMLDTLYTNDYTLKQYSNQAGAIFSVNNNRLHFNFGAKVGNAKLKQYNNFDNTNFTRTFVNWNPQLTGQLKITGQSSIRFMYMGTTVLPTVSQLQPVQINLDPLNITKGNPYLKTAFNNRVSFIYNSFAVSTGQLIGVFANYERTSNPIINNVHVSGTGQSIISYVNLDDKSTSALNLNLFYDRKIKPIDLSVGLNLGVSGNTYYNLSNNVINALKQYTYASQFRFSKTVPEKYDFYFSLGPIYTISKSSLQATLNNNGPGFTGMGSFTVYLPQGLQLKTDGTYQYNAKTQLFNQTFSRFLINPSLSKTFLKKQNAKISFTVNDLLNQNVGFDRIVSGDLITQSQYTMIKRFYMFSLTYDFNKTLSTN